ncbi:hypothetical protein A2Y85_07565 [candidate division WOR-3 bacterium RBG_13_43_14]|uniref:EamA domain-containing protein n=1 Tax=candidate division WOR-3 bacterium RBG_13_43_14 TaxID=1802590 RepID=A0A1F4U9B6_UNCW3|nr:MAG: hypothetical protein A2Y85_07565 [candidate division WOR-3 bacterium RBG_13_43_14]
MSKKIGIAVVVGASIMWSLESIFAKLSYQVVSVGNAFAARTIFSLVIIGAYVLLTNHPKRILVDRKVLPWLVYVSLAATLFADLLYIYALSRVAVINAVLIGHMQPVFIVVIGYILHREDRISRNDYIGIAFMIISGLLVTSGNLNNLFRFKLGSTGDLLVLLATIAWATTAIIARKYLKAIPPSIIAFYRFFFAGIVFIGYRLLFYNIKIISIYQILLGLVIGLGTIMYYEGIRKLKAAQVAAIELSTPFFATVLGFVVLKEMITLQQAFGILLLFAGMYYLATKEI